MKFGLALSGGGFRATLFHLGVVKFLRDKKLLQQVTHICSVSGGSILAAHMLLNWDKYISENEDDFRVISNEIIQFVQSDIRNRIVRRMPFFFRYYPQMSIARISTNLLERSYDKLYKKSYLDKLGGSGKPSINILTTSLSTGQLCSFTPEGFSIDDLSRPKLFETASVSIAFAVTCSSAFPVFPPAKLSSDKFSNADEAEPKYYLSDGGIYDNQGIRKFQQIITANKDVCDYLLISDAGAPFKLEKEKKFWLISTAFRISDIFTSRIRELEYEYAECSSIKEIYKKIRIVDTTDSPYIHPAKQSELKNIRTDLDSFSTLEINSLVQFGYCKGQDIINTIQKIAVKEKPWTPLGYSRNIDLENKEGPAEARILKNSRDRSYWKILAFHKDLLMIPPYLIFLILVSWGILSWYSSHQAYQLEKILVEEKKKDLENVQKNIKEHLQPLISSGRQLYDSQKYKDALQLFEVADYYNESGLFYGTYPFYIHSVLEAGDPNKKFEQAEALVKKLEKEIANKKRYFNTERGIKNTNENFNKVKDSINKMAVGKENLLKELQSLELLLRTTFK